MVAVRGASGGRVSIAGVVCYRPGDRPRLFYQLLVCRRRKGELQRCLPVVEGIGERVGVRVVDLKGRETEGVFGAGEDARERGAGGVGVAGPGMGGNNDQRHPRAKARDSHTSVWSE